MSGLECQKWSSQWPHTHHHTAWDHNYCRVPDSDPGGAWCFTMSPDTLWEYCSQIENCDETCQDKSLKGRNYQGTQSKSKTGITCQKWSDGYHRHKNGNWDHNYCRNPDSDDDGVWCWTGDLDWDYCDVEG